MVKKLRKKTVIGWENVYIWILIIEVTVRPKILLKIILKFIHFVQMFCIGTGWDYDASIYIYIFTCSGGLVYIVLSVYVYLKKNSTNVETRNERMKKKKKNDDEESGSMITMEKSADIIEDLWDHCF